MRRLAGIELGDRTFLAPRQTRVQRLGGTVWAGECPSWYKSPDGIIVNNWSGPASRYAVAVSGTDTSAFALEPR